MPRNRFKQAVITGLALLAAAMPASYGYVEFTIRRDLARFPELRAFSEIAFGTETGFGGNEQRIVKWTEPIGYAAAAPLAGYVGTYARKLAGLTGLEIGPAQPGGTAPNFHIRSLPGPAVDAVIAEAGWQPHAQRFLRRFAATDMPCVFVAKTRSGRIVRADIFLKEGIARAQAEACVQEEVAQALGLPNDTNSVADTVFSDSSGVMELTPLDERLLHLLYLERIEPGMSRKLALYRLGRHLRRR